MSYHQNLEQIHELTGPAFCTFPPDPVVISSLGALDEPNEYKVDQTDSGQSVKDRFYAVGEMQQDFRKDGAQVKE